MATSGYTTCACRDCFSTTISDDGKPVLCDECADAGCDADGASECSGPHAYGCDDETEASL